MTLRQADARANSEEHVHARTGLNNRLGQKLGQTAVTRAHNGDNSTSTSTSTIVHIHPEPPKESETGHAHATRTPPTVQQKNNSLGPSPLAQYRSMKAKRAGLLEDHTRSLLDQMCSIERFGSKNAGPRSPCYPIALQVCMNKYE